VLDRIQRRVWKDTDGDTDGIQMSVNQELLSSSAREREQDTTV